MGIQSGLSPRFIQAKLEGFLDTGYSGFRPAGEGSGGMRLAE